MRNVGLPVGRWRSRWVGIGFVAVGSLVLLLALVDAGWRARDARRDMLAARDELTAAREIIGPLARFDFTRWPSAEEAEAARAHLRAASQHMAEARGRLGWIGTAAELTGWIPRWGEQTSASTDLLDVAERVAEAASLLLDESAPVLEGDGPMVASAHEVFVDRAAALDAVLARLEAMQPEVRRLDAIQWGGPFAQAESLISDLHADLGNVSEGRAALAALAGGFDALFGYGAPSTVLVLGQNDHEIRATGGFIGTMGLVEIVDGAIASSDYRASTDFGPDGPQLRRPPWQLASYLGIGEWHPRDGNWLPDFAASARQVSQMAWEDSGATASHVLAVDTTMVGLLLGVVGPVEVEGFPDPLTADNWFGQVEATLFDVSPQLGHFEARSAYLGPVMRDLLQLVEQLPRDQLPALVTALRQGAQGRHLQLWSDDPTVQRIAEQFEIDGRLRPPGGGDFVAVVDTNVSYSKIQPAILREITYLDRGTEADVVISWTNELSQFSGERYARLGTSGLVWDQYQREFRKEPGTFGNFARIYLPPGVEVHVGSGFDSVAYVAEELGLTVVSGFIEVQDGQRRTVSITYRPPPSTDERVSFWKQGGQSRTELRVLQNVGVEQVELYRGPLDRDVTVPLTTVEPAPRSP